MWSRRIGIGRGIGIEIWRGIGIGRGSKEGTNARCEREGERVCKGGMDAVRKGGRKKKGGRGPRTVEKGVRRLADENTRLRKSIVSSGAHQTSPIAANLLPPAMVWAYPSPRETSTARTTSRRTGKQIRRENAQGIQQMAGGGKPWQTWT